MARHVRPRFQRPVINWDALQAPDMSNTQLCREAAVLSARTCNTSRIVQGFDYLQRLSYSLIHLRRADCAETDSLALSDYFYDCEYQVYDCFLETQSNQSGPQMPAGLLRSASSHLLYLCCSLAAVMQSIFAHRELPIQAKFFDPLVSSFLSMLRQIDFAEAIDGCQLLCLWVVATGTIASSSRAERSQYVQLFSELCQRQMISSWDGIKEQFLSRIHITPLYAAELAHAWNDVEEQWILEGL